MINRLVLTLLGLAFVVATTYQSPDPYLLTTSTTVNLPFAGPASFKTFLVLLPAALVGVRLYLEVFISHWRRLERITEPHRMRDTPVASPVGHPILRIVTWLALYPLVPAVLTLLVMKARAFYGWGLAMLALTLISAVLLLRVMSLPARLRHAWLAMVPVALTLWSLAYFHRDLFQRRLDLQIANLERAYMLGEDLRGADFRRANLKGAVLIRANLTGADFSHADLRGANLAEADLTNANFERADLTGANLGAWHFEGAYFFKATLDGAQVITSHVIFGGAVIRETSMTGTIFSGEWTREQFLTMIEAWGATLCNLRQDGRIFFPGRCLMRLGADGPYYQVVSGRRSWADARKLAESRGLRGPVFADERGKTDGRCWKGALWTVRSAEEQQKVLKAFDPAEESGFWIAASDEQEEGVWRWVGGPHDGTIFWQGGPRGAGGAAREGWFADWRAGEPNNNTLGLADIVKKPALGQLVENWAAVGRVGGWNDVSRRSELLTMIKYERADCPASE